MTSKGLLASSVRVGNGRGALFSDLISVIYLGAEAAGGSGAASHRQLAKRSKPTASGYGTRGRDEGVATLLDGGAGRGEGVATHDAVRYCPVPSRPVRSTSGPSSRRDLPFFFFLLSSPS